MRRNLFSVFICFLDETWYHGPKWYAVRPSFLSIIPFLIGRLVWPPCYFYPIHILLSYVMSFSLLSYSLRRQWNSKNKACHFPDDRNLTLFSQYSQDNCLLECKIRKLSALCGCTPWYIRQPGLVICDPGGNRCLAEQLRSYRDDLSDRGECGCLNDCEMVHFFATAFRESYDAQQDISPTHWFDASGSGSPRGGPSGLLATYLLDPRDLFVDPATKAMLLLAHNLSDYGQLAEKRFRCNPDASGLFSQI